MPSDNQQSQSELNFSLKTENPEGLIVSRRELQLELKTLKSDLRLLILASVALNQFLATVSLPLSITAVALLAWGGKIAISAFLASRGS